MARSCRRGFTLIALLVGCADEPASVEDADDDGCDRAAVVVARSEAAPMSVGRENHTLTQLANGDVIAVGGNACGDISQRLASVERFSLASQSWREVASLSLARRGHAAVALPDGDLLVLGGSVADDGGGTASVARYVADEDRWVEVGTLPAPLTMPRAVLFPNGTTVIVGASYPSFWTRSDDGGATWHVLAEGEGPNVVADVPLVWLPDGGVLNAFGFISAIYDPAFDAWTDGPDTEGAAHVSGNDYLLMGSVALAHQEPQGTIQERPIAKIWNPVDDSSESIGFAGCGPTGTPPLVRSVYGNDQGVVVVSVLGSHARWKRASGWERLNAPFSGPATLLRDGTFMATEGRDGPSETCTALSLSPP